MERLLLGRQLRDFLATSAVRAAKEKLSWPHIADATYGTYCRAINSHWLKRTKIIPARRGAQP
jgi:hypothetical protein